MVGEIIDNITIDGSSSHGQVHYEEDLVSWRSSTVSIKMPLSDIREVYWVCVGERYVLRITHTDNTVKQLDGFRDITPTINYFKGKKITIFEEKMCVVGGNWGDCNFDDDEDNANLYFRYHNNFIFSFPISDLSHVVQPNRTTDVEVTFNEEAEPENKQADFVDSIVFNIPVGEDKSFSLNEASKLSTQIKDRMHVQKDTHSIVTLDPSFGSFIIPRSHFGIEFYDNYCRLQGQKYTHKILYKKISCYYLLPEIDGFHLSLIIALTDGIKQGNQFYPNLVIQFGLEKKSIHMNLDEEELSKRFPSLKSVMEGDAHRLVTSLFKHITGKKVFVPGAFKTKTGEPCLKCSYGNNSGSLYLLETCLVFIHKPTLFIRYEDIRSITIRRLSKLEGGNNTFDLLVSGREISNAIKDSKVYLFSSIDKAEFEDIKGFIEKKNIKLVTPKDDYEDGGGGGSDNNADEEEGEEEDSDFDGKGDEMEKSGSESDESVELEEEKE